MKPYAYECEDGSLLIEWIGQDNQWRLGISIEAKLDESSWYYLSKAPDGGVGLSISDRLPPALLDRLQEQGEPV